MEKNEGINLEVGKNGSVRVPTEVLDHLGLKIGDRISFDAIDVGTILVAKYIEER